MILRSGQNRHGNLYTKGIAAAKAMEDPYEKELEQNMKIFLRVSGGRRHGI